MTGRDIIIYILENNLENETLFNAITVEEAALKYEVGVETIKAWCLLGVIPNINIRDEYYILIKEE